MFSRLYKSSKTQPSVNLVFLLSGGGKFNYFGTKRWLENHLDASSSSELLSDVKFCLCLDTLGNTLSSAGSLEKTESETASGENGVPKDNAKKSMVLNMHVSKPPKEEGHAGRFYSSLQKMAQKAKSDQQSGTIKSNLSKVDVRIVHKKINLADEKLAWEHERFSIRRVPGFTLSNADSHDTLDKIPTILDRTVDNNVIGNFKLFSGKQNRVGIVFNVTP